MSRNRTLAAASRHRVVLGALGSALVAVVAVLVWRSTVRSESTTVGQAALGAASAPERPLEITVLGVHDSVAASAVPPEPPIVVSHPVAAPSLAPPPATVSAPFRASSS